MTRSRSSTTLNCKQRMTPEILWIPSTVTAMSRYNQGINAEGSGTNFLGVVTDAGGIDQILRKIGYVNDAWENVNGQISISYALAGKNAEEVLAMYKELQHVLLSDDSWQSMADSWLGDSSQDVSTTFSSRLSFIRDS